MNSIGKLLLFIAMGALNLPVAHAQTVKELELKIRCALKNTEACFNLGRMYSKGEGVRQDNSKAVELYTKACDGGNAGGCFNLGVMYQPGEGVRHERSRAMELFGKECDLRNEEGCNEYARMKGAR